MAGDETVREHHQLSGHESEQTPEDGGGQEPDELEYMRSQRVGYNLATEQQQSERNKSNTESDFAFPAYNNVRYH